MAQPIRIKDWNYALSNCCADAGWLYCVVYCCKFCEMFFVCQYQRQISILCKVNNKVIYLSIYRGSFYIGSGKALCKTFDCKWLLSVLFAFYTEQLPWNWSCWGFLMTLLIPWPSVSRHLSKVLLHEQFARVEGIAKSNDYISTKRSVTIYGWYMKKESFKLYFPLTGKTWAGAW